MSLQEIRQDLTTIRIAKSLILNLHVIETNKYLLTRDVCKTIDQLNKLINEFEIEEQYIKQEYEDVINAR